MIIGIKAFNRVSKDDNQKTTRLLPLCDLPTAGVKGRKRKPQKKYRSLYILLLNASEMRLDLQTAPLAVADDPSGTVIVWCYGILNVKSPTLIFRFCVNTTRAQRENIYLHEVPTVKKYRGCPTTTQVMYVTRTMSPRRRRYRRRNSRRS